jgi:periplasmic divalent cation tolerance protein
METEFIIVYTTIENYFNAHQIAKVLITEKLAGCCSIIQNITSVFEWEGKVEERKENLLVIKTTKDKFESLKKRIKELHTDQVPEIIAVEIQDGLPEYLNWLREVTK